jgi:CheY-like chemotaxis protein
MAAVLVVDDDPDVLATIADIIEQAGHDVAKAANGLAALAVLDDSEPIDLLLTDVVMPDLNGFNLARMAHLRWPGLKVLYLTGYHEAAMAMVMRETGDRLGKLLTKPITPAELRREIAEVLGTAA